MRAPISAAKPKSTAPHSSASFSRPLSSAAKVEHALRRLTFGARSEDVTELKAIGLRTWLARELNPDKVPEDPALQRRLAPLETLTMSAREVAQEYSPRRNLGLASVNPVAVVASDLNEGKILRAVYSRHQLQELLVDFWYNHFNVFLDKGADRFMVAAYERDAIRPYIYGRFYDLLLHTAESPAMLFYLDNWQSVGENADVRAHNSKRGLNENYARELLELHTLGVDGGYAEADVIAVARCFTGWTISEPRQGGEFRYNDRMHDKVEKVVLGHVIPAGGGMNDGLEVLRILAYHPATARHVSYQLARRFVADDPPPALVTRMSRAFLKTDGDLRAVLEAMLSSSEFWSQGAYRAKVKSPFELLVSALRTTDAEISSAFGLSNQLQKLGEPLYRKLEPTGYSDIEAEWVSSAGLLGRMNFALALAQNRIPGVQVRRSEGQIISAVGSPEFQRR